MKDASADLARSITWSGSKQTYFTARLMADKNLVNDYYRAYAYFRWADDMVDVSLQSDDERISFIRQQKELIHRLINGERPDGLAPEEQFVADLIGHDMKKDDKLRSFILNFLSILEFDAHRKGRLISQHELTWYSDCLGKAVTDGIQYFIGNGCPYPTADNRCLAATAAHITHMLRDMLPDIDDGFVNFPREYLEAHGISPEDVDSPPFRSWVRDQVEQARRYFREGKDYLDELDVLRCKIVGYWYCARFEGILDIIERDGYVLRSAYGKRYTFSTLLKIVRLSVSITLRHIARRVSRRLS